MKPLKPIRWKEGLFLRPHHLQQLELFLDAREFSRLQSLESNSWGLARLNVRTEALDNFTMDVAELRAVLPGGTLIDVPGNARLSSRSFESLMTDLGKPLNVYVGVRAREERRPDVSEDGGGQGISRFSPVEHEVYDLDAGEGRTPIEFLEYDLRYFFGEETQQGYEVLPLTRVVGTGDRVHPVMLEPTFAPPTLMLQGSQALHRIAREVLEYLGVAERELGSQLHTGNPDVLILYQALSACQPVLKDMIHDGMVHPRRVYEELARLAGSLFYRAGAGRSADEIVPYDHRDPGTVFESIKKLIVELTPRAVRQPFHHFDMTWNGSEFRLDLPEEARKPGARCFLEALADQSTHMISSLMASARISSAGQLPTLAQFSLPGVPTEHLPGPPPELGRDAKGTYYRLRLEHDDWTNYVVRDANLAVGVRDAPDDFKLALVVIVPEG